MGLWLLLGLLVASVAVVVWVFRPGAGEAQDEAARQIFRNEEAPRKRVRPAPSKREIDAATQTETTGHEWDGIKELDTPMPRWWLWTLYATIVWGVIYTILFPAWPLVNGATPGLLGYSSRAEVSAEIAAARAANAALDARLLEADLRQRRERPRAPALRRRRRRRGLPQLLLAVPRRRRRRGGRTLPEPARRRLALGRHRRRHPADRHPRHPRRGQSRRPFQPDAGLPRYPAAAGDRRLAAYVLSFSGQSEDPAAAQASRQLFVDNCASCHGTDGAGGREFGAPDLTDGIWLYGGDPAAVRTSIADARFGVMPAFGGRLAPEDIAKVAVYVHSLGGGE